MTTAKLSIWSTFECGLGIAAGSLATLRPLFRKFLGGVRNSIITTKTQISRVRSRYSYAKGPGSGGSPGSPRSSMGKHSRSTSGSSNGSSHTRVGSRGSRGASIDFAFLKKPFHFRKGSEDLEIGCRGESPLTPLGMSGVFDGKTGDGSKLGTQTTITVGMVQPPANAHKHSFSHSRNYAPSEMSEYDYPGRLGFGMIEKETVFETMSEKCGDVEVDEKELDSEKGSSDASSSIYSRDTCGKPQDLPKAWL